MNLGSKLEERVPTESFMYKNTKVNVYGKINIKLMAQLAYNLYIKYELYKK